MKPTWHILGAGAIGCLFACRIQDLGYNVKLITRRSEKTKQLELLTSSDGTHRDYEFDCIKPGAIESLTNLLICTKAQDVLPALDALKSALHKQSVVVSLNNGLGPQEILNKDLPCHYFAGATSVGANFETKNQLVFAGSGDTFIGQLGSESRPDSVSFPELFTLVNNIEERLWDKLAINCLINPLTGIFKCKNGDLLNNPEAMNVMTELAKEFTSLTVQSGKPQKDYLSMATAVAHKTAENYSSMYRDLQFGRQTEIAHLNGYVVNQSVHLGLMVPVHQEICSRIHALEK